MFFGIRDLLYLKAGIQYLPCVTGALWAKWGERCILREMLHWPPLAHKVPIMQASILKQDGGEIREDWKHA